MNTRFGDIGVLRSKHLRIWRALRRFIEYRLPSLKVSLCFGILRHTLIWLLRLSWLNFSPHAGQRIGAFASALNMICFSFVSFVLLRAGSIGSSIPEEYYCGILMVSWILFSSDPRAIETLLSSFWTLLSVSKCSLAGLSSKWVFFRLTHSWLLHPSSTNNSID